MLGIKGIAVAAAVMAMAQPVMAATSLCVEDNATGFNWVNGAWTAVNFNPATYIIKKVDIGDELGLMCETRISLNQRSRVPDPEKPWSGAAACYNITEVGSEPSASDTNTCTEFVAGEKTFMVQCNTDGYYRFDFVPNGEFTLNRTYSVRMGVSESRDSMYLSMGKCSVIAP